jgi:NAD(P)-dependent dehydrogenase (short-subunit alcohol dehydrogenase family)
VTSDADVQRAVDTAVQAFGAVHGAVNAAGIGVAERVVGKEGP